MIYDVRPFMGRGCTFLWPRKCSRSLSSRRARLVRIRLEKMLVTFFTATESPESIALAALSESTLATEQRTAERIVKGREALEGGEYQTRPYAPWPSSRVTRNLLSTQNSWFMILKRVCRECAMLRMERTAFWRNLRRRVSKGLRAAAMRDRTTTGRGKLRIIYLATD